ncbi:hypothetical protein TcCL_Unassigned01062 [Trypanosoma cruzi]|nr:hypothetical protein TcCL_Unassigned01062 [Trypanosoma cruzi]
MAAPQEGTWPVTAFVLPLAGRSFAARAFSSILPGRRTSLFSASPLLVSFRRGASAHGRRGAIMSAPLRVKRRPLIGGHVCCACAWAAGTSRHQPTTSQRRWLQMAMRLGRSKCLASNKMKTML